jgi:hypothetical protein
MFANIQGWLYGGAVAELKGIASGISALKLLAAMSIATVFGFVHAFMPGHGKTVLVSYYLGRPGRLLGSIGTSAILVLTHVGSAVFLVLTGFVVIRRTIGGAGRAPAFEAMSSALVVAIGLWLLFRALRSHDHEHATDGRVLAFATGLVPCPLITFITSALGSVPSAGRFTTGTSTQLGTSGTRTCGSWRRDTPPLPAEAESDDVGFVSIASAVETGSPGFSRGEVSRLDWPHHHGTEVNASRLSTCT